MTATPTTPAVSDEGLVEARKLAAEIMVAVRQARFPKDHPAEAHDEFEALTLVPMLRAAFATRPPVKGDSVELVERVGPDEFYGAVGVAMFKADLAGLRIDQKINFVGNAALEASGHTALSERVVVLEGVLARIGEEFSDAVQSDCENGVRLLNEKAAAAYLDAAPATLAAINLTQNLIDAALKGCDAPPESHP